MKKTFEQYCEDLDLLMSQYDYKNSEIIKFDDEYILVNNRKKIENDDLWYDVSMKQNQQGKLMLMILA